MLSTSCLRHRDTFGTGDPRAHRRADTPAGDLLCARTAALGGRSDPGRSRLRSTCPTRTGDRIRPTHSVVTAVPVVGLKRPPNPVLRICLPVHPESPFSNAGMRSHAFSPTPTWLRSPCSRPSSVLSSPPYLPWCDWISYPFSIAKACLLLTYLGKP